MKKHIITFTLALMMVSCVLPAWAEQDSTLQVTIDYEGAWVSFTDENFKLFLPAGWMLVESDETDAGFIAVSADVSQVMWIDVYEAGGATIDGLLEDFQKVESFDSVRAVYFNSVAFVCYGSPESDMFGAITFSADGTRIYFFKFMPYSDGNLTVLATQILSTLSPMGE